MASLTSFHKINPKARLGLSIGRDGRRVLAQLRHHYAAAYAYEPSDGELLEQLLLAWARQDKALESHVKGLTEDQRAAIEAELDAQEKRLDKGD